MKLILAEGVRGVVEVPQPERMDAASFSAFCRLNPDANLELDKYGQIHVMSPIYIRSSKFESKLIAKLEAWNDTTELGEVFSSAAGFRLLNGAVRSPDASWIEKAKAEALTEDEWDSFAPICPDFVAEIRSKTDRLKPLQEKMGEWMENGCRLAFLIDPVDGQAFIYRAGKEPEHIAGLNTTLSGEEVLPGFLLDLKMFA